MVFNLQTNNFANAFGPGVMFSTIIDVIPVSYNPNQGNPAIFISTFSEPCPNTSADPILNPADPLPDKPTTSPNLLDCDKFYAMSQQQQDGCCMKCQDPNIGPNHQCYPYCHCCSKLRERFQKLANI